MVATVVDRENCVVVGLDILSCLVCGRQGNRKLVSDFYSEPLPACTVTQTTPVAWL